MIDLFTLFYLANLQMIKNKKGSITDLKNYAFRIAEYTRRHKKLVKKILNKIEL